MAKKEDRDLTLFPLFPLHDLSDEAEPYKKAWKKINSNSDIQNIAITGDFGIGKSSILHSIGDKKFRFISVDGFLGEGANTNWEYDLLTQLLLCGKGDKDSDLVPSKLEPVRTIFLVFWAILISLCTFTLLFMEKVLESISQLPDIESSTASAYSVLNWIRQNNAMITLAAYAILGMLLLFGIGTAVYLLSKRRLRLKDISVEIGHIKASAGKKDKISCLDLYRPKLIEILAKCNRTIVFEDMDRLDQSEYLPLLSKLHNLNRDVNAWKSNRSKHSPVRFVYVVNDNIFCAVEGNDSISPALKFFDFMVPTVPTLSRLNAAMYMTAKMSEVGFADQNLISAVAPYLYDYRLVNNILNEYQIMRSVELTRQGKKELEDQSATHLMALVIYKNLMPEDYKNIRSGKSEVFALENCSYRLKNPPAKNPCVSDMINRNFLTDESLHFVGYITDKEIKEIFDSDDEKKKAMAFKLYKEKCFKYFRFDYSVAKAEQGLLEDRSEVVGGDVAENERIILAQGPIALAYSAMDIISEEIDDQTVKNILSYYKDHSYTDYSWFFSAFGKEEANQKRLNIVLDVFDANNKAFNDAFVNWANYYSPNKLSWENDGGGKVLKYLEGRGVCNLPVVAHI